ncbi:MAG: transcriptional regulator [bacterium]|nr:transcriptional regulator [bacterium]
MKKSSFSNVTRLPGDYAGLMRLHMIRLIHDDVEYRNALGAVEALAGREDLTPDQGDYLDLLSEQIEKYEEKRYTIETNGGGPVDTLAFLLEENEMSTSDLGRLLGHRELGGKILHCERELSKSHIRILCE